MVADTNRLWRRSSVAGTRKPDDDAPQLQCDVLASRKSCASRRQRLTREDRTPYATPALFPSAPPLDRTFAASGLLLQPGLLVLKFVRRSAEQCCKALGDGSMPEKLWERLSRPHCSSRLPPWRRPVAAHTTPTVRARIRAPGPTPTARPVPIASGRTTRAATSQRSDIKRPPAGVPEFTGARPRRTRSSGSIRAPRRAAARALARATSLTTPGRSLAGALTALRICSGRQWPKRRRRISGSARDASEFRIGQVQGLAMRGWPRRLSRT
jgi:hypothetical protein